MPVYVDASIWPFRGQLYCHMLADSLAELHAMADKIGLRREWFQSLPKASTPHYDLSPTRRAMAVRYGAIEVDRYQMSKIAASAKIWWRQEAIKQTQPLTVKKDINAPEAINKKRPYQAFEFKPKI